MLGYKDVKCKMLKKVIHSFFFEFIKSPLQFFKNNFSVLVEYLGVKNVVKYTLIILKIYDIIII